MNLGFLVSHRGSNMQAVIDACKDGRVHANPCVVISNNADAYALERARLANIPTYHISTKTHPQSAELDIAISNTLTSHQVDLVLLTGYMKRLGPVTLQTFHGKIINIHPSLLPKYGGQGMYGHHVHEAVLAAGEPLSGATVHLVEQDYDQGPILAQVTVPVLENDTVSTLAERVLGVEHRLLVDTLAKITTGKLLA